MAGLQPTLSDTDFENWVKAGLSLQYTKDGIDKFVDTVIGYLHQAILNKFPSGVTCTNCTTENIVKCERNNNFCRFAGRPCVVHDPSNISKCYRPCPSNVCDKIRDAIITNHRYSKPPWQNTDARQWCTNRWKIAVCYMSVGYSQTTSASETDLPGLLNVIINNTYFQTYVTDNLSDDNNLFRQARTSRNNILHNPRQRLTYVELRAHIATFTAVLSDAKSLSTDTNGIDAITKLKQIENKAISITTQHAMQILAEAFNSIKEAKDNALDAIKEADDTMTENIKKTGQEALKPITDAKDNVLDAIQEANDTITETIKKTGQEALKPITDAKDSALDAIQKTTLDHIESITEKSKQLIIKHSETLIEKKNEIVAEITNMTKKDRPQEQSSSITEIRHELVSLYQTEARFLTTRLYPLIQHRNRNIEDLYVPPNMQTVDKETMKPDKEVNSLEDIFLDNSKNIYVVADAGMGKSALCKKIVSDWCKSKSDNETTDSLSTDQKAIQKFSFVFYISLRDCNTDLQIIDMIKHQLLDEICGCGDNTLISLLRNEKCLIVLDGLDEWNPKVTPNTSNSSKSPVIIPDRKGVRDCSILTTTRPWKLEAVRLESSQIDKQIKLLGIGTRSHKMLIQHLAKQMSSESEDFCKAFLEEVRNKKLDQLLSIPIILKQLVCIWRADNQLRKTKSSTYSQMLNLLFKIAQSRLQDNVNYIDFKSTDITSNIQLPECFAEDEKCKELGSLLCPLSKVAFETLLSDTPESSLVFEMSTTEVHGLTQEQLNICLDIGILSQTKYFSKQNYMEENTKISFLHKTYQEFLAALWISLETNEEIKLTNIIKFKNKCNTITAMFELSEFLIFVSGMNSKTACELSEHTREITTQSDIIRKYRQSVVQYGQLNDEVKRVQKLMISCMKEGWECTHTDSHLYLEDIYLGVPWYNIDEEEEDIAVTDRLIKINKSNIKSIKINKKCLKSHDGSLLEVSGLEKLMLEDVDDNTIIQRLLTQSSNSLHSLRINYNMVRKLLFKEVGILQNIKCLTRLHLENIYVSHIDMLGVMSYISQSHHMKEIVLDSVVCKYWGYACSAVLDLSHGCSPVLDLSHGCSPVLDLSHGCSPVLDLSHECSPVLDLSHECSPVLDLSHECSPVLDLSHECSAVLDLSHGCSPVLDLSHGCSPVLDLSHGCSPVLDLSHGCSPVLDLSHGCSPVLDLSHECSPVLDLSHECSPVLDLSHECSPVLDLSHECSPVLDLSHECSPVLDLSHECSAVLDLSHECSAVLYLSHGCSPVLDLSQHDQLEYLCLERINVAIDTVVNVTNMVKCELGSIEPVMTFVNVTKSLHKASKLTDLEFISCKKHEEVCAILECISHLKHIERLQLWFIDFGSNELVLPVSSDYKNLEYVKLYNVTMTKESWRGVIDSILACNQAVRVDVRHLYIKPVEDIGDILDNVRQSSRCQVMGDKNHEEGTWKIGKFEFKTITRQQT